MRKLTPLFLLLATFFFVAAAVGIVYSRTRKAPVVETVHPVTLLQNHADPAELIIRTGETVRFDNGDGIDHSMYDKANSDPAATTWSVPSGGSNHVTFPQAGTFEYGDKLHPAITVKVVVYDPKK